MTLSCVRPSIARSPILNSLGATSRGPSNVSTISVKAIGFVLGAATTGGDCVVSGTATGEASALFGATTGGAVGAAAFAFATGLERVVFDLGAAPGLSTM